MSPKERFLLLVQNDVHKDKYKKQILTEADKHALSDGWKPKDNFEVKEYNKYCEAWRVEGELRTALQIHHLDTQNKILRSSKVVEYALWNKFESFNKFQNTFEVNELEALATLLKNSGLEYDKVIHGLTFHNMPNGLKEDILALYPDARTEIDYLEEEEILFKYFQNNKMLNKEEIQNLTNEIVSQIPWDYVDFLINKDKDVLGILFNGYFAGLPLIQVAKKWASLNQVIYNDEDDLRVQLAKEKDLKDVFKSTILRYLEDGLFISEYTPLCNSTSRATCNNKDTKQTHQEVITAWIKEKQKSKELIENLINKGDLKVENKERKLFTITKKYKLISGESLYNLGDEYLFAKDFKRQVDKLACFNKLIQFLKERKFIEMINEIGSYARIYTKLSKVFETDFSYITVDIEGSLSEEINLLKTELTMIYENVLFEVYKICEPSFLIEIFTEDILEDLTKKEVINSEIIQILDAKYAKIFGEQLWKGL